MRPFHAIALLAATIPLLLGRGPVASRLPAGVGSHGGDTHSSVSSAAWYTDHLPIRYCISVSPKFPWHDQPEILHGKIRGAFDAWMSYLRSNIGAGVVPSVLTRLEKAESCDSSVDLTFHFGDTPEEVTRARSALDLESSIAFYDDLPSSRGGRKSGFIWFADPGVFSYPVERLEERLGEIGNRNFSLAWTDALGSLDIMLRHEIGHILGNPHIPGTIMDEHIQLRILQQLGSFGPPQNPPECLGPGLRAIDRSSELMSPEAAAKDPVSYPFLGAWDEAQSQFTGCGPQPDWYLALTGRKATAPAGVSIIHSNDSYVLRMRETPEAAAIDIPLRGKVIPIENLELSFTTDPGRSLKAAGFPIKRQVLVGSFVSPGGETYRFTLQRNTHPVAPLVLQLESPGPFGSVQTLDLFFRTEFAE